MEKSREIHIHAAYEHNLKHISVDIPLYRFTGLTGVSGSGKSSLLKNVLAASGELDYTRIQSKTVKDALLISDFVKVESVSNMPLPLFIAVKNTVSNANSTVATLSGVHETLRNMFISCGEIVCPQCGQLVLATLPANAIFSADLIYNEHYALAREYIEKKGHIQAESFFDRKQKPVKPTSNAKAFANISFSLFKPNDQIIREFNKQFNCRVLVTDSQGEYDPLTTLRCSCGKTLPKMTRPRLSFATVFAEGGGACRHCGGRGLVFSIDHDALIQDPSKSIFQGGIRFLTEKGLTYTTVTECFVQAAARQYGIALDEPVCKILKNKLDKLLFGSEDIITFTDRRGGKKSLAFQGIANYLCQSFSQGKGATTLANYCTELPCPECGGLRFDRDINSLRLFGKTMSDFQAMTLSELGDWVREVSVPENVPEAKIYLERLERKANNFCRVSCGHIALGRPSNTLSGGEQQRLRICAMLNSHVSRLCYLLDEPSSGLHASEVDSLGQILRELCAQGNTVIMVEHNPSLLRFCDHIVDLGPTGGSTGGNLLFSDSLSNIAQYDTATAKLLSGKSEVNLPSLMTSCQKSTLVESVNSTNSTDWLIFSDLLQNNLKQITVHFPRDSFSVICGLSGSGKSTLLREVIYKSVRKDPSAFRVKGVSFLGQGVSALPSTSTVATLLKLSEHLAKMFAAVGTIERSAFMPNTKAGKCLVCEGKGVLFSENGENLGVCDICHGAGFSPEVLAVRIQGHNISEILHAPLEQLGTLTENKKLQRLSFVCDLLGIGYLTLSRKSQSLSNGELQRVKLAYSLTSSEEKGQLYLLDEPSKGLHNKDITKLAKAIRFLVEAGNTVIAVEHNAHLIACSNYLVELGGTGKDGGYLLYSGCPAGLSHTPTEQLLHQSKGDYLALPLVEAPISAYLVCTNVPKLPSIDPASIKELVRRTTDEYQSVAIPNNIFFSKTHTTRSLSDSSDLPYFQLIIFTERIRYDISLYAALGIREKLIACAYAAYPDEGEIFRYVLHEGSPTGKCSCCGGRGMVGHVDENLFIEKGKLTKACVRFLQNSTNYKEAAKSLKAEYGLNITHHVAEMDADELQVLLWGWRVTAPKGNQLTWEGLMAAFLRNHSYYPDPEADRFYASRKQKICPICQGSMLKTKYSSYQFLGIPYKAWLGTPIKELYRSLDVKACSIPAADRIRYTLSLVVEAGLGEVTLGQTLAQLEGGQAAMIRWISMFVHRTQDIGIIATQWQKLEPTAISFLQKTALDWQKTNPVILI